MLKSLLALLSGVIFGLGLIVAGMANPAKVLAFLDVTGQWDPSLALVMAGAIAVAAPAFMWARRRERSLLGNRCRCRPPGVWIAVCWRAARCSASGGASRAFALAPPGVGRGGDTTGMAIPAGDAGGHGAV